MHNTLKLIFPLIILDLLIGPASPLLSLQTSVILITILSIINFNIKTTKIYTPIAIFILLTGISTFFSLFNNTNKYLEISDYIYFGEKEIITENIKRFLYIILSLVIYFFVRNTSNKCKNKFKSPLIYVIYLYIIFAVFFIYNKDLFYQLKNFFFSVQVNLDDKIELINSGYLNRFSFIFLDPNNAGYFILMIAIFLIENNNLSRHQKIITYATLISAPILNLSAGTLYTLLTYIAIKFAISDNYKFYNHRIAINKRILFFWMSFIFIFLILMIFINLDNIIMNLEITERLSDPNHTSQDRLQKYNNAFSNLTLSIIGYGYILETNSQYFRPHSDHLRIIFSFGIISYASLVYIVLKNINNYRHYLFALPAFAAFTMNSLIDETRFLISFLTLLAIKNSDLSMQSNKISNQAIKHQI